MLISNGPDIDKIGNRRKRLLATHSITDFAKEGETALKTGVNRKINPVLYKFNNSDVRSLSIQFRMDDDMLRVLRHEIDEAISLLAYSRLTTQLTTLGINRRI